MTKPIVGEIYIYKGEEYTYTEDCDKLQEVPYFELYVKRDKKITTIPNGSYKKKTEVDLYNELFRLTNYYWYVEPITVKTKSNRSVTKSYRFSRTLNLINLDGLYCVEENKWEPKYNLTIRYKDTEKRGDILKSFNSDNSLEKVINQTKEYLVKLYKADLKELK